MISTDEKKAIIITGSNTGIGFAIAKQAALRNQRIVLACRNISKAEIARQKLRAIAPEADVIIHALDLTSFESIIHFTNIIENDFPRIDILINNAGVMPADQQFTEQGFEMQFGVNYLGHFLLTHLLLPALEKAPKARIIHLSSLAHFPGRINFESFYGRKFYLMGFSSYAQSKLANVLFSNELSRRLPPSITSNAVHPGFVDSDFFRTIPDHIYKIWQTILLPPDQCGRFIVDMALSAEWESRTGRFVSAKGPLPVSRKTQDQSLGIRLYNESCRLTEISPLACGY